MATLMTSTDFCLKKQSKDFFLKIRYNWLLFCLATAAISTIDDAKAFYESVVSLCTSGMSRHAALQRLGKDRKTFVRIEPICQLMITQPDVFKTVGDLP